VKRLRTASTRSLVIVAIVVFALAVAGAAIAVAKDSGPTPPSKPLADALHDAVTAPQPDGITARVQFTNNLFPSGALTGGQASALMSSGTGRLWLTNDGRGRLELQSDAGDAQVVWNDSKITVYDASSNTVYEAALPAQTNSSTTDTPPTVADIQTFLTNLGQDASVSDAQPSDVAGQPAYTVSVSPKHDGGLLGSAQLAWDAATGVPLRVAIYAAGNSTPALELAATDISYGPVASSDVDVAPPSDAKVVDLGGASTDQGSTDTPPVTGLANVQAAAGFPVAAPDTLVGLPRQDVRLVGQSDSHKVIVTYGQGLGGIVVVESPAKTDTTSKTGSDSTSLPSVAIGSDTGQELSTELGTAILWQHAGVDYVLAGSVPAAAAEAAARALQ
jgi:outer membrane lipoprotein-sorting protein